jgi:hypothetical protein
MAGSALGGSGTQNPTVGNASPALPSPSRSVASEPSVRNKDTHCDSTTQYLSSRVRIGPCTPRRLVGIECLRLERLPLRRGEVDPVQRWGLLGPGSPYSRSTMMLLSMHQCEIQTRQVSGQEPDFSKKMTNLAGRRLRLVFFNSQTGGTGAPSGWG